MSAKQIKVPKDYPVPPPRKGWRWLVDERTQKGDRFQSNRRKFTEWNPVDMNYYTEGPNVFHLSGLRFEVSGYIRRLPKKRASK